MTPYATMLGTYPDTVANIQFQAMGSGAAASPYTKSDELSVRKAVRVPETPNPVRARDVTEWSEIDDKTFYNDPMSNCPQMQREFTSNLDAANQKYTANKKFEGLFEDMKVLGVQQDKVNFKNAHIYLDDYVTSKANKKPVPSFPEQTVTDQRINNYHKTYLNEGKFGNGLSTSRVASHNFLNYVLTTMYGKVQSLKGNIDNSHYKNLKYSQFVGNENALVSANKMLNYDRADPPNFGDNLRFELYESQGQYYVRTTENGAPVSLAGTSDGIMTYEAFSNYLYQQLYFGDVEKYCRGEEDASKNSYPVYNNYEDYLKTKNPEFNIKPKPQPTQTPTPTTQPTTTTTPQQNKDAGWVQQGFTEIKQKPEPPKPKPEPKPEPEPKVIEIYEPVYVYPPPQERFPARTYHDAYAYPQPMMYQQPIAPQRPTSPPSYYQTPYVYERPASPLQTLVTSSPTNYEFPPEKPAAAEKCYDEYAPCETREHEVDIPYLHSVELQQVVHEKQVVVVPQKMPVPQMVAVPQRIPVPQKVVEVQERIVTEKPTEVHHIQLQKPAPAAAPVQFAEKEAEKSKWPWWWWLPLLGLLC